MNILVLADLESKRFYDYYTPGRLDGFDLIISCGDLSREYLEFLVTMARCPLLYVHGNHDDAFDKDPPGGCICIEDDIFVYRGVRFFGLGGSYRYKDSGEHMYTELQMRWRVWKCGFRIRKNKGFDVLVTHAPAFGIGDSEHISHRGFKTFVHLMEKYRPKYLLHGHMHRNYGPGIPQVRSYQNTTVVNAFEYYQLNYQEQT
ncbi:MAG: metallophosphoesterase family protein [Parasporobacterium sp.]|nr:metallophosphoesterase family protein [Parasporobacterium sp.]